MDLIQGALGAVLPGAVTTLEISICAWVIAVSVGLVVGLGRDSSWRPLTLVLVGLITILRSLPQLISLYVVFYGLGQVHVNLDPFPAAVIGLGIAESAYAAEYYRASFLTVTQAQREAGLSLGLSKFAVIRLIVIPEAIPFLVPPLLNSFVGLMKAATVAAAIGAPEILYAGRNYMAITGRVGEVALVIIALYLVVTIPLTRFIGSVEGRIRAPYAVSG